MTIQERIMAKRAEQDLMITFIIPGRADPFVCYPKDEASKAAWLANAAKHGWRHVL